MSTTNLEEAAAIAAEYISSLDNLPQEVHFLLDEINIKDQRTTELQQEINNAGSKYIRHSVKSANGSTQLSAKDANIPSMVKSHYAEIDRLANEKLQLSERMIRLISRAEARLEHDLNKVLVLQGEGDSSVHGALQLNLGGRGAVNQVIDVLKSGASSISIPEAPATPISMAAHPNKRRKTMPNVAASTVSIKLPSPAPVLASASTSAAATHRSRLSQQVARQSPARQQRSSRVAATVELEVDEDAEGEEDLEENGEENGEVEDKELYCFCQKLSYGEMVACDNPSCRYQWFHLPCVNLKPPLPHVWYCSECAGQFGGVTTTAGTASGGGGGGTQRKGRKK